MPTCAKCNKRFDASQGQYSKEKVLTGRSGGGLSFGTRGKSVRYYTGRNIYRYKQVFTCQDCTPSGAISSIFGGLILLLFIVGFISQCNDNSTVSNNKNIDQNTLIESSLPKESYSVQTVNLSGFITQGTPVWDTPESGSGITGHIKKGTEIRADEITIDQKWYRINYSEEFGETSGYVPADKVAIFGK